MALYRKDIKGYIGPITDQSVLCPSSGKIDGLDVDLGTLTIDNSGGTPKCMSSNKFIGAGGVLKNAQVNISGKTNQCNGRPMRCCQTSMESPNAPA